ncbi:MAG: hypothetical protein K0Q59_5625 [Paenibacillus sp.]|jgi:hypothetical protein|nr:hypothetical protein [Paenibacillus sp.]
MDLAGYPGFLSYAIPLWLVSGVIILRIDTQGYKLAKMDKERKMSRFSGWLNIALGLSVLVGNWLLEKWVM